MFPPWSGMGFSDTATHRIYADAALGGILTITVAQPLAHRRAVTAGLMGSLALPLLLIVPFSLIGVWLAVRAGMAPLGRFRAGVEARGGADLSPFHLETCRRSSCRPPAPSTICWTACAARLRPSAALPPIPRMNCAPPLPPLWRRCSAC